MFRRLLLMLFLNTFEIKWTESAVCTRFPTNVITAKSPVDENFAILINNNAQNYILGQEYNISVNAYNGHRFISFILALENENGNYSPVEDLGQFVITDSVETRYSPNCDHMVESTNTNLKTHAEVSWVAPSDPSSGCVLIRATLLQHRDVWHMDDGRLTRRICQEIVDEVESRKVDQIQQCCACDEARYELTFQRIWNRNLHPKDFPPQSWTTRFGDIIGAAHTAEYRFWQNGELATDAMQEYAEHGSTRSLEKEFNAQFTEGIIRTIIRARGPVFPNIHGISLASVRVDPRHHLISLGAKIDPSPDWFVGIAGMELCNSNCTWLEERVVHLYPWDAGTDAGPSYTSSDQPQKPPDVIRRLRSDFPNDPRSPFYDETGAPMVPFATLRVRRQKVYERSCENEDSNNSDIPQECYTHPWTAWTECSVKCGEGHSLRTRVFKQPDLSSVYNCDEIVELKQERSCSGEECYGQPAIMDNENNFDMMSKQNYLGSQYLAECELSEFGEWSTCSKTCGEGIQIRKRQFLNSRSEKACQSASKLKLMEYRKCQGQQCLGDLPDDNEPTDYNFRTQLYNNEVSNGYSNRGRINKQVNGRTQIWQHNEANENAEQWQPKIDDEAEGSYNRDYANSRLENNVQNSGEINNVENRYEIETSNDFGNDRRTDFEVGNLNRGYDESTNQTKIYRQQRIKLRNDFTNNNKNEHDRHQYENDVQILDRTPQTPVPPYCFASLNIFHCHNLTVVGNFWFYNYCEDECMLFAANCCDKNINKFTTLEACEQMCRSPQNAQYLQQQRQHCNPQSNLRKHNNKRQKQQTRQRSYWQNQ